MLENVFNVESNTSPEFGWSVTGVASQHEKVAVLARYLVLTWQNNHGDAKTKALYAQREGRFFLLRGFHFFAEGRTPAHAETAPRTPFIDRFDVYPK